MSDAVGTEHPGGQTPQDDGGGHPGDLQPAPPDGLDPTTIWQFAYDTWTGANEAAYGSAMQAIYGWLNLLDGQLPRLGSEMVSRARAERIRESLDRDIGRAGESLGRLAQAMENERWDSVNNSAANLRRNISNLDQALAINAARSLQGAVRHLAWMVQCLDRSPRLVRAIREPVTEVAQALGGTLESTEQARVQTAAVLSIDAIGEAVDLGDTPHDSEIAAVQGELSDLWSNFSDLLSRAESMEDEPDHEIERNGGHVFGTSPFSLFTIDEYRGGDGGDSSW